MDHAHHAHLHSLSPAHHAGPADRRAQAAAPEPGAGAHGGHDAHAGHDPADFRSRFWLTLALALPTIAFGHMFPAALGWHRSSAPRPSCTAGASSWSAPGASSGRASPG